MDTKSQDLFSARWSSADEMRKIMSADVYKDYVLGLIFYKAVSDSQLRTVVELLEESEPRDMHEAQEIYEGLKGKEEFVDVQDELKIRYGCAIEPEHTFTAFYNHINDGTFLVKELGEAFNDIEQSTIGNEGHRERNYPLHFGKYNVFDLLHLVFRHVDVEFVMHLHNHLCAERFARPRVFFGVQTPVDTHHRHLDNVCCGTLNGRIDGIALSKRTHGGVVRKNVWQIAFASE